MRTSKHHVRRTSRWIAVAVLAASVFIGCSSSDERQNASDELNGLLLLRDSDLEGQADSCRGSGGYSDFAGGAPVTVRDAADQIIATTRLRNFNSAADVKAAADAASPGGAMSGKLAGTVDHVTENWTEDFIIVCSFQFSTTIPDSDFYSISIGSRDPVVENRSELEASNWAIAYTIGS